MSETPPTAAELARRAIAPPESDPTGRAPSTPGAKLDAGKAPVLRGVLQYFPLALAAVAEVSAHGAAKYTWKGWETVPDGVDRYGDALARHLLAENAGPVDRDSGLPHAAHAAWNALARLELSLRATADKPTPVLSSGNAADYAPHPTDPLHAWVTRAESMRIAKEAGLIR